MNNLKKKIRWLSPNSITNVTVKKKLYKFDKKKSLVILFYEISQTNKIIIGQNQ